MIAGDDPLGNLCNRGVGLLSHPLEQFECFGMTTITDPHQQAAQKVPTTTHVPRPLKPLSKDRVATSPYGSDSCAYTSLMAKTNTPAWPYQINFIRLKFNLLNI